MARKQQDNAPVPAAQPRVQGRQAGEGPLVEVRDPKGELVGVTVYERGAAEVMRRLAA
jgi:hypothetical protein